MPEANIIYIWNIWVHQIIFLSCRDLFIQPERNDWIKKKQFLNRYVTLIFHPTFTTVISNGKTYRTRDIRMMLAKISTDWFFYYLLLPHLYFYLSASHLQVYLHATTFPYDYKSHVPVTVLFDFDDNWSVYSVDFHSSNGIQNDTLCWFSRIMSSLYQSIKRENDNQCLKESESNKEDLLAKEKKSTWEYVCEINR